MAKLVGRLLATAALSNIQNGRLKQRSGQHTLARKKERIFKKKRGEKKLVLKFCRSSLHKEELELLEELKIIVPRRLFVTALQ